MMYRNYFINESAIEKEGKEQTNVVTSVGWSVRLHFEYFTLSESLL